MYMPMYMKEDNSVRKFQIKVNGVAYEVEVEETTGSAPAAAPVAAAAPAAPAAPAPRPVVPAAPAAAAAPAAGSEVIKAPMPGTILSFSVAVGDTVKKGQVLCILEAMKMENEIVAPRDGTIAGIHSGKNSSVNAGDALVSLQ